MDKIRVLFPYVEAGFGHIMPMKSVESKFREKYGDKVEIVSSRFFTETNNKYLIKYQNMLTKQVRTYNSHPFVGYFATLSSAFFGSFLSSIGAMHCTVFKSYKAGMEHMKELKPDVVFSTHWVTNYYAQRQKSKPLTIMYCPDARLNPLFEYPCDMNMISMPYGYLLGLRKKQYNINNFKYVPFLIRNNVFDILPDKKANRIELGLPVNKFTVLLAEGGYGLGKMWDICKLLVKLRIPVTVVAICGKNEKLLKKMKQLIPSDEVTFIPLGFTEDILRYTAASDIFCGKSGNMIAEPTFFGVPSIITNYSTLIEQHIGDHYINTVGCSIKEFSPKKAVALIESFVYDRDKLTPYIKAAEAYHKNFGSDKAAEEIWNRITQTYPQLLKK